MVVPLITTKPNHIHFAANVLFIFNFVSFLKKAQKQIK